MQSKYNLIWIKIFISIFIIIQFYWQDLIILFNEAINNDITTHILVIPIILAYILYRLRIRVLSSMSIDVDPNKNHLVRVLIGVLLCTTSYIMKLYGSYTFQPLEYRILSLPIFISGIVLILFNYQTLKDLTFPIFFTLFLMPPPLLLAQQAGAILSVYSSRMAYIMLKAIGLTVSLSSEYGSPIIYLQRGDLTIPFSIDLACSGIYSLIGFLIFSTFTAFVTREKISYKLAIFLIGFPLIYSLNVLRIIIIVLTGQLFGPDTALNVIHYFGGWVIIFLGTIILLQILERILDVHVFNPKPSGTLCQHLSIDGYRCSDCGKILEIPDLILDYTELSKLVLVVILISSLSLTQIPVFTLNEGTAEVFTASVSGENSYTTILPKIVGFDLKFVYRDTEFESITGQDAAIMFIYDPNTAEDTLFWVGIEIGSSKYVLHQWEACLISYPLSKGQATKHYQIDLRDIHLLENPPLSARYFVNKEKQSNVTQVILYWYTKTIFRIDQEYTQKWSKISLIRYIEDESEYMAAENELLPYAEAIVNYWHPISRWSWVSLVIAEKGIMLMALSISLVFVVMLYYIIKKINVIKEAKLIYNKIAEESDREFIDILNNSEADIITESMLIKLYEEKTGRRLSLEEISGKLSQLEKLGVVEKRLKHIDDEQYLTWESNLRIFRGRFGKSRLSFLLN